MYDHGHAGSARACVLEHGDDPAGVFQRASLAASQHDYAAADPLLRQLLGAQRPGTAWHENANWALAALAEVRGQLGRSAQFLRDVQADAESRALPADYIGAALAMGWLDLHYGRRPDDAVRKVAAALKLPRSTVGRAVRGVLRTRARGLAS